MTSTFSSQEKIEGIRNLLYVLDYDEEFLNLLEREKEKYGIYLVTETDAAKGKEHLLSQDFHPRISLISETFPGSTLTGFDIIEEIQKSSTYLPMITGILLAHENLDSRLKAARKGIKYVFCKPVSPIVILESMSNELAYSKNLRILILDDDENACKYVEDAFNELGIDVKIINDPLDLYKTLEAYSPHVLLLDILLPKYDGLDLLKVLRSDPIYRDLIIVIITHYTDMKAKEMAYANRATDILYKPLEKSVLQVRILELVKQHAQTGGSFSGSLRLGLESYPALVKKLHSSLLKNSAVHRCLVFFEIDKFSDFILQESRLSANNLLVVISNLLSGIANEDISCYFIEDSKFALYIENKNLKVIENQIYELLKSVKRETDASISISCGIVPITKRISSVPKLLSTAEKSLLEAKNHEENTPVKIVVYADKTESMDRKEVILVDPDVDLLKMTKMALESHGLDVKTYTNGEDALNAIFQHKETEPPSLIISERRIPDMDGMEFFNRVKARYHVPIPFYFLTVYSSDHDISEGLKEGALQYITKPFNMSLLVQRVIQTVQGQ
jgi:DNA-binding response OmpR family regulator